MKTETVIGYDQKYVYENQVTKKKISQLWLNSSTIWVSEKCHDNICTVSMVTYQKN